jgi:protease-4
VATSRRLTLEEVDAVGGGRVWTGLQALEHGLVDEIGGLDKAAAKARELAGLHPRARIREVRPSRSPVAPSPLPDPATIINYAREGLGMFDGLKPLLICPISPDDVPVGG